MKCMHKKEKIGDSLWLDIGTATTMTYGVRTDIYAGQSFTSNIGALERLFVGARASMFLALKMDFNLLKSELNICEEKVTTFEKKGVVTGMKTCATKIGTSVSDMVTTAIANRIGGLWMYV